MAHTPDPSSKAAPARPQTFNSPADDILARARAAGLFVDAEEKRAPAPAAAGAPAPAAAKAPERPKPAPAPPTKAVKPAAAPVVARPARVAASTPSTKGTVVRDPKKQPRPARETRALSKKNPAPVAGGPARSKAVVPPSPKPEVARPTPAAREESTRRGDDQVELRMADAIERMVEARVNAVLQASLSALFRE